MKNIVDISYDNNRLLQLDSRLLQDIIIEDKCSIPIQRAQFYHN